jgi:hypothetical protein
MAQPNLFDMLPEGNLTQEEAEREIEPFANRFVEVWMCAWRQWQALPADFRGHMHPRTRANIVHDLAVGAARLAFPHTDSTECCERLGFFKIYIGERIVVRLKRLDGEHLACNIATGQQKSYYTHRPINGVREGYTRLTIGYTLNATCLEIESIVVSLQNGLEILVYSFVLDQEANIIAIPEPIAPDTTPTVRIKGASQEEAE